jgi:hypothetical protein
MPRERGEVSTWALANDRHRVLAEGEICFDEVIVGHDEADELAFTLARRMGESTYGRQDAS